MITSWAFSPLLQVQGDNISRQNFSLPPFCFQDGGHMIFHLRCSGALLLLTHFTLSTIIPITSGENSTDFQWHHKNNMAAMGGFIKYDIGIVKQNSGRLTLNVFLMLPLHSVHGFYPIWGIVLKWLKHSALIVTKNGIFGQFTTGKFYFNSKYVFILDLFNVFNGVRQLLVSDFLTHTSNPTI